MRLHVPWTALLLPAAIAAAAGCAPPEPPAPAIDRSTLTPTFTTSWTPAQRDTFYHLAEGSEIIPMGVMKALINPATRRPILADPERYGLIPDPESRHGNPVGVTQAETVDTRLIRMTMFGLNCSACHVAQIEYQGKALRVDGAPAHFDADTFRAELIAAVQWNTANPIRVIELVDRMLREPHGVEALLAAGGGSAEAHRRVHDLLRPHAAPPAGDTAHAGFTRRLHALLEEEAARAGISHAGGLGGRDDDPADRELRARYTAARDSLRIAAVTGTRPDAADDLARKVHSDERVAEAHLHDYVENFFVAVRLLNDRRKTLEEMVSTSQHRAPALPRTSSGPGRVDAFDVARNLIYVNDLVPENAPVSYPWLWGFTRNVWLHYDANTNSVMERNMGQALGVGAIFDRHTAQSTLNPINIHALEMLSRRIEPPRWPVEMFGALDAAKVRRGETVFNRECASCHYNGSGRSPDTVFEPWAVGTDSTRIVNFAAPLADTSLIAGRPAPKLRPAPHFTDVVGPLLHKIKAQSYALFGVTPALQDTMNGCANDTVWRTTRGWQSRPLSGIWATAPYLHNGSVPTLHDLLRPAAERPDSFIVGNREYDPVKLGYVSAPAAGRALFIFRTSQTGNGNGGHEYGTRMSEDDRMALLEYLKDHTLPVDTTFPCPGGTGTRPPGRVPPRQTR
ncbi:MAG TPA: di-heme-cytochrome C peroxidase [Longimicrobium sp.]|nr:di-heme-cytochrome C peroxidase [Longimicrobium sp.]